MYNDVNFSRPPAPLASLVVANSFPSGSVCNSGGGSFSPAFTVDNVVAA